MELTTYISERAKLLARELRREFRYEAVGAEEEITFEYCGNNYTLKVWASWEKINHYEYTVKGIDIDYELTKRFLTF